MRTDLQFSSEDEFDEVPFGADEQSKQTEIEALEVGEIREVGEVPADDDSQQAAEAMVQLSNVGFYTGEQQLLQQGKYSPSNKKFLFLNLKKIYIDRYRYLYCEF